MVDLVTNPKIDQRVGQSVENVGIPGVFTLEKVCFLALEIVQHVKNI